MIRRLLGLQEFKKAENDFNYYAQKKKPYYANTSPGLCFEPATIDTGKAVVRRIAERTECNA